MRWYVARDGGRTEGPFEGAEIASLVAVGGLTGTDLVQDEGGSGWVPAGKHPVLGVHLRSHSPSSASPKRGRRPAPWLTIGALAAVLTFLAAGALIFLQLRTRDALLARIDNTTRHVDGVLTEIREANALAPYVSSSDVHNNCTSDRTMVTCTFTNLLEKPITTCAQGVVRQKESPGVQLKSLIMCTGKLYPLESRVVTGPWVGGFADDICYRENAYGKILDWSKCKFDTGDVDIATVRAVAAVK